MTENVCNMSKTDILQLVRSIPVQGIMRFWCQHEAINLVQNFSHRHAWDVVPSKDRVANSPTWIDIAVVHLQLGTNHIHIFISMHYISSWTKLLTVLGGLILPWKQTVYQCWKILHEKGTHFYWYSRFLVIQLECKCTKQQ